ncbi:MAG: hypothetical protein PW896_20885 [Pseudomonas sp.]|jgi:hypothetical protein|uniref:hypothetical protein n=1 Tax=Pseudomonas sp. TaxID=306 RepID=UPI0023964B8B|nr:hypothetical protein [Pseudomonas sp.]MDE1197546.1 hypothetical protein [Pseudomonas sp.]
MRYLKVAAQDRSGNGKADTVLLQFHDDSTNLVFEAFAIDLTADGSIEFSYAGDINGDGKSNLQDEVQLTVFAQAFLQLNWFNIGRSVERYLKIEAKNYHADGSPNVVNLQFTEDDGIPPALIRITPAAAYDGDNDGTLDSFTNSDVNGDGVANTADKLLMRKLAESYLAFCWFED